MRLQRLAKKEASSAEECADRDMRFQWLVLEVRQLRQQAHDAYREQHRTVNEMRRRRRLERQLRQEAIAAQLLSVVCRGVGLRSAILRNWIWRSMAATPPPPPPPPRPLPLPRGVCASGPRPHAIQTFRTCTTSATGARTADSVTAQIEWRMPGSGSFVVRPTGRRRGRWGMMRAKKSLCT